MSLPEQLAAVLLALLGAIGGSPDTAERESISIEPNRGDSRSAMPELLLTIRSEESGHGEPGKYDYRASNPSGCEGYGCGGAYQLHAAYASTWAARAGYKHMPADAATWPPATQDAVALHLFLSTQPAGSHWCDWADYC